MANKISVLIDVTTDKANRALSGFRKSISDADGAVGKFKAGASSAFASLKANAVPIATAAGAAMIAFGAKAIKAASDLGESVNAVEKTFGDASEGVLKIGEDASKSMGLSERAFNQGAVSFAAFAETIAGEGGDVSGVIADVTQRAADFASVHNIEVAEAMRVFQSTLAGETEAFRRYGGNVSAAAVEHYALSNGLIDSKREMTDAIKVQARYGLLMGQTSNTAGDFADTSGDLANASRTLAADVENLAAEIGDGLVPAAQEAVGILIQLLDKAQDLGLFQEQEQAVAVLTEANRGLADALTEAGVSVEEFQAILGTGATTLEGYRQATAYAGKAAKEYEEELGAAERAAELNAAATEKMEAASEAAAEAHANLTEELQDLQDKIEELTEAQGDLVGAEVDLERSTLNYQDAMISARMVIDSTESSERDRTEAVLDAKDAIRDQAEALADNEIATREANGEVLTASDKNAILADHYRDLAENAIPEAAGAAREWADDLDAIPGEVIVLVEGDTAAARTQAQAYITKLGGIPASTETKIMALIDQGRIDAAERALNNAARDRTSNIRVNVTGGQLVQPGQIGFRAKGGPVQAGKPYVVGEEGPELITPKSGGMVHDAKKTAEMFGAGSSGSGRGDIIISGDIYTQSVPDLRRELRQLLNEKAMMA